MGGGIVWDKKHTPMPQLFRKLLAKSGRLSLIYLVAFSMMVDIFTPGLMDLITNP
jgi:hypothetical protein